MKNLLCLIFLLRISAPLFASDHCSLVVKVSDPQGKGVDAPVTVVERSGRVTKLKSSVDGARFCDLGISPVDVFVGDPACNQSAVRTVPLEWDVTSVVAIIYDRSPCVGERPPVPACEFLIRFVDGSHNGVSEVSVRTQSPYELNTQADTFGRFHIRIPASKVLVGTAAANGYRTASFRLACTVVRSEEVVSLTKDVP
jgi:hypothetical protein